ncbi:MAG: hypothetical protein U0Y96_16355 [Candidatus Kapaibacterium sp.]|nr:hypothetical protein [Bacteroidota bacterium]
MKLSLTLAILIITTKCFGQTYQFDVAKVSEQTKEIVYKIEKENMLMHIAVGQVGTRPQQYDNFVDLQKIATKDELQELTNHPNGVVRCYSFWALTKDTSVSLLPIILKHITDDEIISEMSYCVIRKEIVGDFFYSFRYSAN